MTPAGLAAALSRPRKLLPNPPEPQEWLDAGDERIAIHTLGRPEAAVRALFVHGWETDHRDLAHIAETLAGNGAYCVAPDLPAHGTSSGASMTIPEAAGAIQAVHQTYGPFELAAGYSMGAAILLYAMAKGMPAGKVALIAPPGNYAHELGKAARAAGASEALIAGALVEFRRRCPDLDELDSERLAPSLSCPGIVAVAGNDGVLDPQNGRSLAKLWRGSRLLEREQASHRSILRDPAVAEAIAGLL